MDFSLSNWCRV